MRSKSTVGAVDRGKAVATVNELGHLASGVGHHVINAFSAVVSNAEILRMKLSMPNPPDPTALADSIIRTALEAAAVARRLIDVTRPLTDVGHEEVALDHLIEDYVAKRAEESGIPVRWTAAASPIPPILGNEAHLRSMLDHLVANAIEAAGPDGVTLSISTSLDNRGWVVLEVRDTGRGMTTEVLERAVEPFFSTKTNHLGVGLSIANGIWRRHKGTLSVRSVPSEGTLIRLCVEPAKRTP
jgi:two-component system NtrC family sensor kinase